MGHLYHLSILISLSSLFYTSVQSYSICGGVQNRYVCDINNPKAFHICLGDGKHTLKCPSNLHFNAKIQICDWPDATSCPYDNYSGEDDAYDYYEEENDRHDVVESGPYLSAAASKSKDFGVMKSPYTKPYQSRRKDTHSYAIQERNERTTSATPTRGEDFNYVSANHVYTYGNDYRNRAADDGTGNLNSIKEPRKTHSKLRKGRRRKTFANSQKSLEMNSGESIVDEKVPTKYNSFSSRRHPSRSLSPYAPPSDAYNSYSHLGTNVKKSEFRRPVSNEKRNHHSKWQQRSHSSSTTLSKDKNNSPAQSYSDKSSRKTLSNSVRHTQSRQQNNRRPTSHWMHSFNSPTQNKEDNSRYAYQSDRDQTVQNDRQQVLPMVNERRKTYDDPTSSQREIKQFWTNPSDTRKIAHHPLIRPYRPWRLADLIQEAPARSSYKNNNKPILQFKQSPPNPIIPAPAVSVNGDTIHPYKPNQLLNVDAAPKRMKSFFADSKISSYFSKLTKNKKRRGKCSSSWCKLPSCRCIGSDIPGALPRSDTPMMVMLTFDDGVNHANFHYYREIFDGSIRNPNGCPIKGTFFVSGDSTNYEMVRELNKDHHEIASHTLSHRNPTTWWARAGVENWEMEVVGMKNRLSEKSNVPLGSIKGMRAPFLQVGGDDQFIMLSSNKFRYDSSMVTGSIQRDNRPPIWPFTLDTPPDSQTCNLTPCPRKSYPGLWEIPLIRWYGDNQVACAMPDSCSTGYGYEGTMAFLEDNFRRHYKSNKAPLGIFIHASWFKRKAENFDALKDFISSLVQRDDVWLLTASQVLDWMEQPRTTSSLNSITSWQC